MPRRSLLTPSSEGLSLLKDPESLWVYFHLSPPIRATFFNEHVIVLDLEKDEYLMLPPSLSQALLIALRYPFQKRGHSYESVDSVTLPDNFNSALEKLRDVKILATQDFSSPFAFPLKEASLSAGAANLDWRLDYEDLKAPVPCGLFMEAYKTLAQVYFYSTFLGFKGLIASLQRRKPKNPLQADTNALGLLVAALNQACFYFPIRVKCLEWSIALIYMAFRRQWKCNLEIGVQTTPFLAHAWVRANQGVIADAQTLPHTLSLILQEPFRDPQE